jgi:hypothetical protein
VARWRRQELFPAPLAEFEEAEWPPVEGECLKVYACRRGGYDGPCVPDGACGSRFYGALERDYPPGEAAVIAARYRRADAWERFRQARMSWLGEDHPEYVGEMIEGWREQDRIRRGRPRP